MPLKMEDTIDRVVPTVFLETIFKKDGSTDTNNLYERIYLNENDKVTRVVQFSRPAK